MRAAGVGVGGEELPDAAGGLEFEVRHAKFRQRAVIFNRGRRGDDSPLAALNLS